MLLRFFTIIALAVLAVGTWYVSSPRRSPAEMRSAGAQSARGYYLKGTVLTDYDLDGKPTIKMAAERIEQIPRTQEIQLLNVRLDYQTTDGQLWILVGDAAQVAPGGKIVDVKGNVRLQGFLQGREGPAVVRTDEMTYDIDRSEARTDQEVHLEFGRQTLNAQGLIARLKERTMRLESKVNGRFHP
jgi:LPS export ABC transporter protein LptC